MAKMPTIGSRLVRADDPAFALRVGACAMATLSTGALSEMRRDVVLISNESTKSVAAYVVRWSLHTPQGTDTTLTSVYIEPGILNAHKTDGGGTGIAAGAARVLHQGFNLSVEEFAGIVDDPRKLAEPKFASNPYGAVTGAELDGVLYDDGTFYGPDKADYFLKLQAQLDASRDLGLTVLNFIKAARTDTEIVAELQREIDDKARYMGSTASDYYYTERGNQAKLFLFAYNVAGHKGLLNNAAYQAAEPKHKLVK